MSEEKVKVVLELDKDDIQGTAYLLGVKLTDEMYQKLTVESIPIPTEKMKEGDLKQMKIAFACFALAKVMDE